MISYDRKIIECGSPIKDFVLLWEAATGESLVERMKWSEGQHVLDEIRRTRLCGKQECDAIERKDRLSTETTFRAVCSDKKKVVLQLKK